MIRRPAVFVGAVCLLGAFLALGACSKDKKNNATGGGLLLDSGNISTNATYAHAFGAAGSYNYHCTIHSSMPSMHAVVICSDTSSIGAANVNIAGYAFSPPSVIVGLGGTVTWKNLDGFAHTVTSE